MKKHDADSRYLVGTLDKGLEVLEQLERAGRPLNIQQITDASGVQRGAVYRLLYTLARRGYVIRLPNKKYAPVMRRRQVTFGYMAPLTGSAYRSELVVGLRSAAELRHVGLQILDNLEDDVDVSLRNAQSLIDSRIDLAIMFEPVGYVGHVVANRFLLAEIPLVAVDTPVPGALYFGSNNFQAGELAGRALGEFCLERWEGRYDLLILIESSRAGAGAQARVTGVLEGLRECVGEVATSRVVHLDGRAHTAESRNALSDLLRQLPAEARLLISCFNDLAVLGALQALRKAGRVADVAVVGQSAGVETRAELRDPESPLVAAIGYFPERYGEKLISLGLSVVNQERVPPSCYTEHVVLTHVNIGQYYG